MDVVSDVASIADPTERTKVAHEQIEKLNSAITALAEVRRAGMLAMLDRGMRNKDIAAVLHLSTTRISQLLTAGGAGARAFLGAQRVVVAIGGKLETGRPDGNPEPVLSAAAHAAYEVIAGMARAAGLDAAHEIVPPPGIVDLNRASLLVLTSPRLLPFVGQVLASDPWYGFDHDDNGWFLVDKSTGEQHRSPQDSGQSADYAYLGRLPRPDGRGTFLYLAGIHSAGTLGAALYLAEHLSDLHKMWKLRRWSVLLRVAYNSKTREIAEVSMLTPAQAHEGGAQ